MVVPEPPRGRPRTLHLHTHPPQPPDRAELDGERGSGGPRGAKWDSLRKAVLPSANVDRCRHRIEHGGGYVTGWRA